MMSKYTVQLASYKLTRKPELVREFIHDCLYNDKIGYFQQHVNILSVNSGHIPFNSLKNQTEYNEYLTKAYMEQSKTEKFFQLWHTPSELFRPWYGQGIGKFLIRKYKECSISKNNMPLVIYEIGPGNGTLCEDVLSFMEKYDQEVFARVEYNLIEISERLVKTKLIPLKKRFPSKVRIHNQSFFDWQYVDKRPSTVIAIEVFDNLPQDRIRFTTKGALEQALVVTNDESQYQDEQERYTEVFVPANDPLIIEAVNILDKIGHSWPSLQRSYECFYNIWPLSAFPFQRPWSSEFIPTMPIQFFKVLAKYFPSHQLLLADFDSLPDCISGHGAPVVQTRYQGETVACSTYLLERGLFDIFFPFNFITLGKIYEHICERPTQVIKHVQFGRSCMDVTKTRTRSGYNPLEEDFTNVSYLIGEYS